MKYNTIIYIYIYTHVDIYCVYTYVYVYIYIYIYVYIYIYTYNLRPGVPATLPLATPHPEWAAEVERAAARIN